MNNEVYKVLLNDVEFSTFNTYNEAEACIRDTLQQILPFIIFSKLAAGPKEMIIKFNDFNFSIKEDIKNE